MRACSAKLEYFYFMSCRLSYGMNTIFEEGEFESWKIILEVKNLFSKYIRNEIFSITFEYTMMAFKTIFLYVCLAISK